jgi:hypothetical protein
MTNKPEAQWVPPEIFFSDPKYAGLDVDGDVLPDGTPVFCGVKTESGVTGSTLSTARTTSIKEAEKLGRGGLFAAPGTPPLEASAQNTAAKAFHAARVSAVKKPYNHTVVVGEPHSPAAKAADAARVMIEGATARFCAVRGKSCGTCINQEDLECGDCGKTLNDLNNWSPKPGLRLMTPEERSAAYCPNDYDGEVLSIGNRLVTPEERSAAYFQAILDNPGIVAGPGTVVACDIKGKLNEAQILKAIDESTAHGRICLTFEKQNGELGLSNVFVTLLKKLNVI